MRNLVGVVALSLCCLALVGACGGRDRPSARKGAGGGGGLSGTGGGGGEAGGSGGHGATGGAGGFGGAGGGAGGDVGGEAGAGGAGTIVPLPFADCDAVPVESVVVDPSLIPDVDPHCDDWEDLPPLTLDENGEVRLGNDDAGSGFAISGCNLVYAAATGALYLYDLKTNRQRPITGRQATMDSLVLAGSILISDPGRFIRRRKAARSTFSRSRTSPPAGVAERACATEMQAGGSTAHSCTRRDESPGGKCPSVDVRRSACSTCARRSGRC